MKYTLQAAVFRWSPAELICLVARELSAPLSFRASMKFKELEILPEHGGFSHPKAGSEDEKSRIKRLGLGEGLSSHCHPVRRSDLDSFPKNEKWMDLAHARAVVLLVDGYSAEFSPKPMRLSARSGG